MTAAVPGALLETPVLTAIFHKGATMLGNHWRLVDGAGTEVGRTKRVYEGMGGKVGKRLAVATGLSTAGSVTIEVLAASGAVVGSVFGKGGERTTAVLSDAGGSVVGRAVHEFEVAVTLQDDAGRLLGTVETPPDSDAPAEQLFAVLDADGRQVAVLARDPHAYRGMSLLGEVFWGYYENFNYEAELLRHYGFRRSNTYSVALLDGAQPTGRLRTMVAMLPVLAGHLY